MKYAVIVEIRDAEGETMKIIQPSIEIMTPLDGDCILGVDKSC